MTVLLIPLAGCLLLAIAFPFIRIYAQREDSASEETHSDGQAKTKKRKAREPDAERLRLGYRYADNDLFVHDRSVWTGVRLKQSTDEHLSEVELHGLVEKAAAALKHLARDGSGMEIHVRATWRPITAEDWAEQKIANCWNPTRNHITYTHRIASILEADGSARPEVYLFIKIDDASKHVTKRASTVTGVADEQFPAEVVGKWAAKATEVRDRLRGLGVEHINRDDVLWVIRKSLHGHLTPPPVTYAARRPWGSGEFRLAVDFHGYNRKTHTEIDTINEDEKIADYGVPLRSYVTVLAAAEWPQEQTFRQDKAWLRTLMQNRHGIRPEVSYRARILPSTEFQDVAKKVSGDLEEEVGDQERTRGFVDPLLDGMADQASNLVTDIRRESIPGIESQIMVAISADSIEEMERHRRYIENLGTQELDITFVRPRRFQWRMFHSLLPGAPFAGGVLAPYVRLQEAEVFGVGLPTAGLQVGDAPTQDRSGRVRGWIGDYIGTTSGVPVHYSLGVGPQRDAGGGCAILGASGSGKSTLALLKFWQESEAGVRCSVLDPKVDFAKFSYYLSFGSQVNDPHFESEAMAGTLGKRGSKFTPINKEYWDETQIIDVLKSDDGVLDAWQIAGEVRGGEMLAETMFSMFLGRTDWETCRTDILSALQYVVTEYDEAITEAIEKGSTPKQAQAEVPLPTMWAVVEHIKEQHREMERAREQEHEPISYEALKASKNVVMQVDRLTRSQYSRLAFAKDPQALASLRKRRTIFTLRGIETPPKEKPNPDDWSPPQRRAATILYATTRLQSELLDVRQERNPVTGELGMQPKALFVDEAYVITSVPEGRDLLKQTLAQGRSYGLTTVIIDQQAARLAAIEVEGSQDGSGNQFHSVFGFMQKTRGEGKAMLPMLGREDNTGLAEALMHEGQGGLLDTGLCVFRDVDMRAATVDIDIVFAELLQASDTNPGTRPQRQSIDPPADVNDWRMLDEDTRDEALDAAQELFDEAEGEDEDENVAPVDEGDTYEMAH